VVALHPLQVVPQSGFNTSLDPAWLSGLRMIPMRPGAVQPPQELDVYSVFEALAAGEAVPVPGGSGAVGGAGPAGAQAADAGGW
jgi:hypothetical protein